MRAAPLLVARVRYAAPRRRRTARAVAIALTLSVCLWTGTGSTADLEQARQMAREDRTQDALAEVQQVLAQRPGDVEAMLLRGVLLGQIGNTDAAIQVFNDIANAHPEVPEPHNNLAVLYAAQGRYERARDALLEAVRLQPNYDLAHENLGDVYAKLAELSYARAHQVNPANDQAARKAAVAEAILSRGGRRTTSTPPPSPPAAKRGVTPTIAAADEDVMAPCLTVTAIRPPSRGDAVVRWLSERGLTVNRSQDGAAAGAAGYYRVFLPPLANRSAATQRIGELRAAGVNDLIMIREGEYRHGIALGVFSRRAHAERRVRDLEALGIDAQIEEPRQELLSATRVSATGMVSPASFARAFPDLTFSTNDCQ